MLLTETQWFYRSSLKLQDANPSEPSYRAAASERPEETLRYRFDLNSKTNPTSIPFPTLWLSRDVDIEDWVTLACLPEQPSGVTKTGEFERYVDEISWRRKIFHISCGMEHGFSWAQGSGCSSRPINRESLRQVLKGPMGLVWQFDMVWIRSKIFLRSEPLIGHH